MRKVIALMISIFLILFLCIGVSAAADDKSSDIVILFTNDVHAHIDGPMSYDTIGAIKKELEKQYRYVLLVDAGDHLQGTAYGATDKGASIVQLMNAAGYDLVTPGNHEFDYGMDTFLTRREEADFSYISCNFYRESQGIRADTVLDPFCAYHFGKEIVAFIGISSPETITKSTPAYFQDEAGNYCYGFSGGEDGSDLYTDVQATVDAVRRAGATKVIALGHLGNDASSSPWTSEEVIAHVAGLDAFLDGHSHSVVKGKPVLDAAGNAVSLNQTGEYLDRLGLLIISYETGEIRSDFITCEEIRKTVKNNKGEETTQVSGYRLVSDLYTGPDWVNNYTLANQKQQWIKKVNLALKQKIGEAKVTFDNYSEDGIRLVRSQETNTGDFAADALYYLFDSMGLDVDVAIMNGGGIRNTAVTGKLTYKTCREIHTFGNVACLQTVTGQQLLDALEWGARFAGTGEECGGFLQVSGIQYQIDTDWPDSTRKDDKGMWIGGPTGGYRVHDVKVYHKETALWEPLDLNGEYNLAGYSYTLRNMGDGFNMFDATVNIQDYVMEDYLVLANYVQAFEKGIITADNSPLASRYPGFDVDYGSVNGTGRIRFCAADPTDRMPDGVEQETQAPEAVQTLAETEPVDVPGSERSFPVLPMTIGAASALILLVLFLPMLQKKTK